MSYRSRWSLARRPSLSSLDTATASYTFRAMTVLCQACLEGNCIGAFRGVSGHVQGEHMSPGNPKKKKEKSKSFLL